MKVLVTGARGFIGRNLIEALKSRKGFEIFKYDREDNPEELEIYCRNCEYLFHFAAVHRPDNGIEFEKVNHQFFSDLLNRLRSHKNSCPVLLTSSIQAEDDTDYGRSKKAAEKALVEHSRAIDSRAIIYRLTNTFGRYARPNSHSVVATFCHHIARGLPIQVNDPERVMQFYYIDDVIESFIAHIDDGHGPDADGFYRLPPEYKYEITLEQLAQRLYIFKKLLGVGIQPVLTDTFTAKLFATYQSYSK